MWIVFTFVQLFSFMWGQHRHSCILEMVFRFTCIESDCSAVEVACLAQNILHSSASVRLHLAVLRWSLVNNNARSYLTIFSPLATGGFGGLIPQNKTSRPINWNMKHCKSVEFLSIFIMSSDPFTNVKPTIEDFLATVLTTFTSLYVSVW